LSASPAHAAATAPIMDSIFAPLTDALAASFDGDRFSQPAQRERMTAQLEKLAANVGRLEQHARSQDRTFAYVARSLGDDARRLLRFYKRGAYDEASFTLHNMTENCIACHSSLPQGKTFPDAKSFLSRIDVASLHPLERARLQVMSRQFDDALGSYEAQIADKAQDASLVVSLGSMADYLRVAIGVKSDFKRPQATLARLRDRPLTPQHVRDQLDRWLAELKAYDAANVLADADPLARARAVMSDARTQMEYPRDRDVLIHYVTADALLSRYIHAQGAKPDEALGEAYYLRGIAESLLEHSYWLSRAEFYFEASVRAAPKGKFAQKALARLSEHLIDEHTGSSGTRIPPESAALLDELKALTTK
jgi:hypothetical protein